MVVAPPGVGKSLFLVNQSVHSLIEGRKVLYISLEMSEDKIAQRFDSIMTLVPQFKLKDPASQLMLKRDLNYSRRNSLVANWLLKSSLQAKPRSILFAIFWYSLKTMMSLSLICL